MPQTNHEQVWTIDQAIGFCMRLSPRLELAGFGLALGGSVLSEGSSKKDLDLVVYPHNKNECDFAKAAAVLEHFGLTKAVSVKRVHAVWRAKGSNDTKHVEIWKHGKQRIDFFFLT